MKNTCKTCPFFESAGNVELVMPSTIAANDNGGKKTAEAGICHFSRPQMMIVQKPGKIQGSMTVEQQRMFPQVLATEGCGDHPDFQQDQWGLKVATALRLYAGRLEYDPDRHHTKTGFSRVPSLDEAKAIAANKDQLTGENES